MTRSLVHGIFTVALATGGLFAGPAAKTDLGPVAVEIAAAATAFLSSLDEETRPRAALAWEDPAREDWHYVPRQRAGLTLAELDEKQRAALRGLLEAGMSAKGLLKADSIITLEAVLAEIERNPVRRDQGKYHIMIFGKPDPAGTWAWRFEGHHLSINFTLVDGRAISATPSFFGANPAQVRSGEHKGKRPLAAEEDLARALAAALRESGKPVVFSADPPHEILTGARRKATQLDPVGVPAADMSPAQRDGLLELIGEYATRHRREIAEKDMRRIRENLESARFGWAGGLAPGEAYYYRIQGAHFLIEAANVQNDANHIHTVWRDLEGDFARDILGNHHRHHDHDH